MRHTGEPRRFMSGEHGTFVAREGDELPPWVTPTLAHPTSSSLKAEWLAWASLLEIEGADTMTVTELQEAVAEKEQDNGNG